MRSQKRGILIIVNNIHFINKPWLRRNGAETDRDNLVHVFRQMGFFVCVQEDLTKLVGNTFLFTISLKCLIGYFINNLIRFDLFRLYRNFRILSRILCSVETFGCTIVLCLRCSAMANKMKWSLWTAVESM